MIERKKVKCPIGTRPYTEMCLDHRSLYCSTCKKGVCAELDPDFIARLQSIIEQQEVSIKAYKKVAKRWMKRAKWLADIDSRIGCYACVARFNNCGIVPEEQQTASMAGVLAIIDRFTVEEPLTVRSIVDKIGYRSLKDRIWDWLAVHEYQGLYCKDGNDTCGCNLDDFCPCGCPQPDCRPAYRHKDGMMYLEDEKDV